MSRFHGNSFRETLLILCFWNEKHSDKWGHSSCFCFAFVIYVFCDWCLAAVWWCSNNINCNCISAGFPVTPMIMYFCNIWTVDSHYSTPSSVNKLRYFELNGYNIPSVIYFIFICNTPRFEILKERSTRSQHRPGCYTDFTLKHIVTAVFNYSGQHMSSTCLLTFIRFLLSVVCTLQACIVAMHFVWNLIRKKRSRFCIFYIFYFLLVSQ